MVKKNDVQQITWNGNGDALSKGEFLLALI